MNSHRGALFFFIQYEENITNSSVYAETSLCTFVYNAISVLLYLNLMTSRQDDVKTRVLWS